MPEFRKLIYIFKNKDIPINLKKNVHACFGWSVGNNEPDKKVHKQTTSNAENDEECKVGFESQTQKKNERNKVQNKGRR